jgi:hypothetical protein
VKTFLDILLPPEFGSHNVGGAGGYFKLRKKEKPLPLCNQGKTQTNSQHEATMTPRTIKTEF